MGGGWGKGQHQRAEDLARQHAEPVGSFIGQMPVEKLFIQITDNGHLGRRFAAVMHGLTLITGQGPHPFVAHQVGDSMLTAGTRKPPQVS